MPNVRCIGDRILPAWQVEILSHRNSGRWLSRFVSTAKAQLEIHLVTVTNYTREHIRRPSRTALGNLHGISSVCHGRSFSWDEANSTFNLSSSSANHCLQSTRKDVRFLETEFIHGLEDVHNVVGLVFVLNHVICATIDLRLGRATRRAWGYPFLTFLTLSCGLFLLSRTLVVSVEIGPSPKLVGPFERSDTPAGNT